MLSVLECQLSYYYINKSTLEYLCNLQTCSVPGIGTSIVFPIPALFDIVTVVS